MSDIDVVTGAFGYTGRYITGRLLESGRNVKTLTGHPNRPNPFGDRIGVAPLDFEERRKLAEHLRGATTLYNTYWVRFPRGDVTFERAVANSQTLIGAARDAGVRRIVHVSITNPSKDSPFGYFRGKARVEEMISASGLGYSIIRPTVVFGRPPHGIRNESVRISACRKVVMRTDRLLAGKPPVFSGDPQRFAFGLRDLSVFNRAFEGVHIGSDVLVGTDTGQPRDDPSKVRGSRLYPAVRDPNGATISPWQRRPCGGEHQIGSEQLHQGHPGGLGFAQIDGQELGRRARILQGGVRADTR
jgi:nucleoside-diphosphate-sugar epimerase